MSTLDKHFFPQVATGRHFATLLRMHFDYFITVPDSVFKTTYPHLPGLVVASRENHAVAEAFGARLGGKRPCVLIQNSGLGLALDALLGLFSLYGVGLSMVISERGELPWEEVQHREWGQISGQILSTVCSDTLDLQSLGSEAVRRSAAMSNDEGKVSAVIVHRGNLSEAN